MAERGLPSELDAHRATRATPGDTRSIESFPQVPTAVFSRIIVSLASGAPNVEIFGDVQRTNWWSKLLLNTLVLISLFSKSCFIF
jgi:hypothetical protein